MEAMMNLLVKQLESGEIGSTVVIVLLLIGNVLTYRYFREEIRKKTEHNKALHELVKKRHEEIAKLYEKLIDRLHR